MSGTPEVRTVLGIPGNWSDRSEIVTSIVSQSGGYLFGGTVMLHLETTEHFLLEVSEQDPRLAEAFMIAGGERFTPQQISEIDRHKFCLYLSGPGGSVESAKRIMNAARALLNSGGLAVKVESAGTAHTAAGWRSLCSDETGVSLVDAFTVCVGDEDEYYTCGMQNLGYPDCIVSASIDPAEAAHLLRQFLLYLFFEEPTLNSGETFSVDANAPRYRLLMQSCVNFPADDLFHNPYGIWRLQPV